MKIRSRKMMVYNPLTFEPVVGLVLSYNPEDAQDAQAKGENIEEQLTNEFQTLLTRSIGWDSEEPV